MQLTPRSRGCPRLFGACLALAAGLGAAAPARAAAAPAGVVPPRVVQHAPLVYPADGGGLRVALKLQVSIDAEGRPGEVRVLERDPPSAPPSFTTAALAHVRALRFSPAMQDGAPMAAQVVLTLRMGPPEPQPAAQAGAPAPGAPATSPGAPAKSLVEGATSPGAPAKSLVEGATSPGAPAKSLVEGATSPGAPAKSLVEGATSQPAPEPGAFSARVRGALRQGERATSDFNIEIGQLSVVPRRTAAELLTLAPGILLTNEGGEGHAQRVFLRGFDAREGQDLEFTVEGVPINEVANAHGQGYADTHFIIPETIDTLRVVEGPFDPRQGDFAVAGSADYRLGVRERGLRLSYTGGSFGTNRMLLLWAPDCALSKALCRDGTFAAVELAQTQGYGQNRFSQRAAATAQADLALSDWGRLTVLAMSYATRFQSPGVVRQDDYEAGRIDFFGTYDPQQGGDAQRHGFSARLTASSGPFELAQQAFLTLRDLRVRENFTGFLLDVQRPNQSPRGEDPQRGDLLDQDSSELTVGARGSARLRGAIRGLSQQLEVGYYARYDRNQASQRRLRAGSVVPYLTDFDFATGESNVGAYLDAEIRPLRWLALRGGVRGDFFHYDVDNRCDNPDTRVPRAPLDVECYSLDRYGYRNPTARRTATGLVFQPRVTLQIEPTTGLLLTGSYGQGARSADPLFVGDGEDAPFAQIRAGEGGGLYHRALGPLSLTVRGAFYYTHVDRDLIFNQTLGRPTLASGTTRLGLLGTGRLTGPFVDAAVSVTWARATFDDSGLLVPYVPELVARADAAGFGPLPKVRLLGQPVILSGGLGFTYVAPRPLPLSERGDAYVLLDLQVRARWHFAEVSLSIENLLDRRYRLSEFNYVSDFRGQPYPTLVAERHFIAGPPLTALATVTLYADRVFSELRRHK